LDRLYDVIGQIEGVPIPASVLEVDVLAGRVGRYESSLLDELLSSGEVMWVGAGSLARDDGKVVLARRDRAGVLLPRFGYDGTPDAGLKSELHIHLRDTLERRGACFFREMGRPGVPDSDVLEALWDLVWAGEVTSDGFSAVRATLGSVRGGARAGRGAGRAVRPRPRPGSLRALGPPRAQGRWSLVAREFGPRPDVDAAASAPAVRGAAGSRADTEATLAVASVLLERHGVLTRDGVRAESIPGGFAGIYPVLKAMEDSGRVRRGYFIAGMGGAQFALPGAVDRLRAAPSRTGRPTGAEVVILAAADPANAYGLVLSWPVKGPSRVPGSHVIVVDGIASAYLERGGRGLVALRDLDGSWEDDVAGALVGMVSAGRWRRLALRRYPETMGPVLEAAGFTPSPKGLVKYA
jgi:ATP-dependent Lhr-like helicase